MSNVNVSTLEINLLGQRIVLKASDTEPELIQEVLQLVNSKLSEAEGRARNAAPHQVALLALMDLAEEYIKAKKRTINYKQNLDDKTKKLFSLIEAEFQ